jgi:hypothetical protein
VNNNLTANIKDTIKYKTYISTVLNNVSSDLKEEEGNGEEAAHTWGWISESPGGLFILQMLLSFPSWGFSYTFVKRYFFLIPNSTLM